MFGNQWYNASIKNYIVLFGAIFNDISIQRLDKNGNPVKGQLIKIPVSYAPKQKWLVRREQDPNAGATKNDGSPTQRQIEIQLPRMGYELKALQYDTSRKIPNTQKYVAKFESLTNALHQVLTPVPYIFPFELTVGTKNQEDMFQIIEQIIPYFTPTFTVKSNETTLPLARDIIIELNSPITPEISPYGDFKETKILTCTLNFNLYGYLYKSDGVQKIITTSDLNIYAANVLFNETEYYNNTGDSDKAGVTLVVTPDPIDAAPDSDFGFIVTKEEAPQ